MKKILLISGVLSSLLYISVNIIGAMRWEGYSSASQTFSELFAIGAPTRAFVVPLLIVYSVLIYLFGWGVWITAGQKKVLRFTATGLIGKEVLGLLATVFFPMNMRGAEATYSDTMHIVLTFAGVLFMLLALISGAKAFGRQFRIYSIITIALLIAGGTLAGLDAPKIAAGQPTPWAGVTERFNTISYMIWIIVLAMLLLRKEKAPVSITIKKPSPVL